MAILNDETPLGVFLFMDKSKKTNIEKLLKKNYKNIFKSIKKEKYKIRLKKPHCIFEIKDEGEVVGFLSFKYDFEKFVLYDAYIMPEFRKKGLFNNYLIRAILNFNRINIYKPSRYLVELLVNYGYAKVLFDDVVATSLPFETEPHNLISSEGKHVNTDVETISYNYDLSTSRIIILDDVSSTPNACNILYSKPLDLDKGYPTKEMNKAYFENIKKHFIENNTEYTDILKNLFNNLPAMEFTLDELLGEGEDIGGLLGEIVNSKFVSLEDGKTLKEQITDAYNKGEVSNKGLLLNLVYRVEHLNDTTDYKAKLEEVLGFEINSLNLCPLCYHPVHSMEVLCTNCGYNLDYTPEIDGIDGEFKDLIKGKEEVFSEFLYRQSRRISIKYPYDKVPVAYDRENTFKVASFLLAMDNHNENLLFADYIYHVASVFDVEGSEFFDYLLDNKFISRIISPFDYQKEFKDFTMPQLKKILKFSGLPVSGRRADLVERVVNEVEYDDIEDCVVNLTDKVSWSNTDIFSHIYYNNFSNSEYFYYGELVEYGYGKDMNCEDYALEFLDDLYKVVMEREDFFGIVKTLIARSIVVGSYDENKSLNDILRAFIFGLNPIFLEERFIEFLNLENKIVFDNILFLSNNFSDEDILKCFDKVSEDFDKWIVPKSKIKKMLEYIISERDYDDLLMDIALNYLDKSSSDNPIVIDARGIF